MMWVRWVALFTTLIASVACAQVVEYDFDDGDIAAREPVKGEWVARDGAYLQRDVSDPSYRYSLAPDAWSEGVIEAGVTPLQVNHISNVGASFGLVVKYRDAEHWYAVRFGSYGGVSLRIVAEDNEVIKLGSLQPQPGATRHPKVILRNGYLAIVLDGGVMGIFRDPFEGEPGRPGLFTETECAFDNVRIERLK